MSVLHVAPDSHGLVHAAAAVLLILGLLPYWLGPVSHGVFGRRARVSARP